MDDLVFIKLLCQFMELSAWHFISYVGQYVNFMKIYFLDGDFISWLFDYVGDEHFMLFFVIKFLVYNCVIIKLTNGYVFICCYKYRIDK